MQGHLLTFLFKREFGARVANLRKSISKMLVRRIQLLPGILKDGRNRMCKYYTSLHKGEKSVISENPDRDVTLWGV